MNYELFMGAAIAEARSALSQGERPHGAVAVLGEAMVARGREEVLATNDPTAHAVVTALRAAARRLGRSSLAGVTVFSAVEPCPMCVGALLASDVDGLVYALPDPLVGAAGWAVQLARGASLSRRLNVVSGILQSDARELLELPISSS